RATCEPTANPDRSHTCQYCVTTVPNVVTCRISTPPRNVGATEYPTIAPSAAASTASPTDATTSVPVCSHTAPLAHARSGVPLQYRHSLPKPRQCGDHELSGRENTSEAACACARIPAGTAAPCGSTGATMS